LLTGYRHKSSIVYSFVFNICLYFIVLQSKRFSPKNSLGLWEGTKVDFRNSVQKWQKNCSGNTIAVAHIDEYIAFICC
jgi:hypothetical protein